jgi:DNA polymerase-1
MAWPAWPSATWAASGISYEDLCGKGAHQIPFSQVDVAKAAEYSCEDSDQTLDVHRRCGRSLQADDKLRFIYELEMASSEALYRIERNGVLIDAPTLATAEPRAGPAHHAAGNRGL